MAYTWDKLSGSGHVAKDLAFSCPAQTDHWIYGELGSTTPVYHA